MDGKTARMVSSEYRVWMGMWGVIAKALASRMLMCCAPCSSRGIHFLAVQPDPDSEELNGMWLLQDRMPPQI